jgi:hypothetical protein
VVAVEDDGVRRELRRHGHRGAVRRGRVLATRFPALRLPEGDLAAVGRGHNAAPPGRALAGPEQDAGPEPLRALGGRADLGHRHVGQPERPLGAALDDPPAQAIAEVEGEILAARGLDVLRSPAEQLAVEAGSRRAVGRVKLQVSQWAS